MADEDRTRYALTRGSNLVIRKDESSFLFDNIEYCVALSRDNTSVKELELFPYDSDPGNYEVWDKVGQMVGNLMELETINIHFHESDDDDGDEAPSPDWETFSRILRYLRRKVALCFLEDYEPENEEIQGLARVIHCHPMISEFYSLSCTFATMGPWCATLATLPSLEYVTLGLREPETEDQLLLLNPELLMELLRAPALRLVEFSNFCFTNALCHATANALEEGSPVTDITLDSECSFPDGGAAIIANALNTNASVTDVKFFGDFDDLFCNILAAVLLCNSTLQNLTVDTATRTMDRGYSTIFLALGMNTTLKSLSASICDEFGDELCAAIRNGLAKNSTLEELSLGNIVPSGDCGAVSARNVLSFLRTNSTLKSFTVFFFLPTEQESYVSAFRLEAVKMMEKNPFLESLTIENGGSGINVEELFALVSALQLNTTLKTLGYQHTIVDSLYLSDDEVKQLIPLLMKNYGLERLVPDISCPDDRTVKAILRLNGAGRRYLIEDGSSISKGVEVLSAVNDDINCLFLHLLENPGLCDIRAVETMTRSRQPGANLDESSSSGKRERPQSHPGKEPRRRLA
jgi:hypothetical protein